MAQAVPQKSLSGVITSEDGLVERPGLELLEGLGWQHINRMKEELGPKNPTGRLSFRELVLPARLGAALRKLNPLLPLEALQEAEIALIANRSAMLPVAANREVYRLLREGVSVEVRQQDGSTKPERVAVIDWTSPTTNDFLLGSQFWIESELYKRRPDAVGFINGIPLLFIEWKDVTQPVQEAYDANLGDYRDTIPRLFDFNGFTILSNGIEALMGPSHAPFESFAPWKRLVEDGLANQSASST
jgi:type I restriction enzyme, R subunit